MRAETQVTLVRKHGLEQFHGLVLDPVTGRVLFSTVRWSEVGTAQELQRWMGLNGYSNN